MAIIQKHLYPDRSAWPALLARPGSSDREKEQQVSDMLFDLRSRGWQAVMEYAERFDGFAPDPVWVSDEQFSEAERAVPRKLKDAIELAASNIRIFHESQRRDENRVEVRKGIDCYQRWLPIEKVGIYVPGGTAPLISTVLMLALPASIAGCSEVTMCTPADREGNIHPAILYAARYCGVQKVARLGGVQAIAAMAYGIGELDRVDKIFGPGNSWVTLAKQLVTRDGLAIDMPAGPSEVAVMADDSADPAFVAADLLSQAEHGSDSQSLLVSTSLSLVEEVERELESRLARLPRRLIAAEALLNSRMVVLKTDEAMVDMINQYAPEHLIINTVNFRELSGKVRHAGSVFLGPLTPESSGDYASGTNHTLPTSGYARAYSGLTLDSFMKSITYQELTAEGLSGISGAVVELARAEGLEAHAEAVKIRQMSEKSVSEKSVSEKSVSVGVGVGVGVGEWVRKNVRELKPYSSARDEFSGDGSVFLDANEHPVETGINRYPDPRQRELSEAVARMKGVDVGQLYLGSGSDEAIDLLFRVFCEPGQSRVVTMAPTYGMYSVCAKIQDVAVDEVLLNDDFTLNVDAMLGAVKWNTRMMFICSPNNPTANIIPLKTIRLLAEQFRGILVVDEAYMDFAQSASALSLITELPNLVVLQTFSKAWGMAGLRIGMAFASEEVVGYMRKVKYPYNLNVLTMARVLERIRQPGAVEAFKESVSDIVMQRAWLRDQMERLPMVKHIYSSDANFLLVRVDDAKRLYRRLVSQGIVVRDRSSQALCDQCLRITVGTREENEKLIKELIKI